MDLHKLQEPFKAEDIEWRIGRAGYTKAGKLYGTCLAYVTSRAIMQRLDDVCGPMNWKNEYKAGPAGGIVCGISIYDPEKKEWVQKWDGAENTNIEAVKGGLSDAMKRAGVQWGIGRYLYELEEGFAIIADNGKHYASGKDKASGKAYSFKWNPPALPAWALPGGKPAPAPAVPPANAPARKPEPAPAATDDMTKNKTEIYVLCGRNLKTVVAETKAAGVQGEIDTVEKSKIVLNYLLNKLDRQQ